MDVSIWWCLFKGFMVNTGSIPSRTQDFFEHEVGNRGTVQQAGDASGIWSRTCRKSHHTWDRRELQLVTLNHPWSEWSQNDNQ